MFMQASTSYRLQHQGVRIDGGARLDFGLYPYLCEIIDARAPMTTILKGAQMGFSIACILRALEDARTLDLRGILYLFPTDGEVQDFSKARFGPILSQNEHVWGSDLGKFDSAGLKEIAGTALYFRGAGQKGGAAQKSTSKLKSIPADHICLDERDEMDDSRVDSAEHRLDGSMCPEITSLSTPTVPDYGVDALFKQSDQRHAHWKCPRCNAWTCLEEHYPDCIAEPQNGDPFFLCMKCREELPRMRGSAFEWVASRTDVIGHRGYYASQMCSPTRTASDIIVEHDKAVSRGRMREFYNQVLARPYADIEDRITESQLNDLVTEEPKPLRHPGPTAMGVDPGKPHWYTVRLRVGDRDYVQLDRGRCDTYEELASIARKYNVKSGCMDQGADTTAVRRFVDAHPGWFGVLYVDRKNTSHDWNLKDRLVRVGRTVLLDQARDTILEKRIKYPRKDEFWHEQYVPQMTNLARTIIENPETGARVARWVVTGTVKNDHLRHADAYCDLACERVALSDDLRRARRARQQQHSSRKSRGWMSA